ncbi:MAG: hypothetical protein U9M95_01925 [Candidatus Altiarchaeota archaeon]|nr:hypothetical protein [Candidatus Altiarchaeota archaeon]
MKHSSLFLLAGFVFLGGVVDAATFYMNADGTEDCANLQECSGLMSGGDTLIIRDGVYAGNENVMDFDNRLPSGNSSSYTLVKAEHDGKVIFDGEGVRSPLQIYGGGGAGDISYIQFEGLGVCNSSSNLISIINANHIKMFRCFCYDTTYVGHGGDGFAVGSSSYVLLEDCWSWGDARKHFYAAKSAEKVIFRRCVVRHDRHFDYFDQEAFKLYDCKETEVQNCISIDGDQENYYTGGTAAARSYGIRDTAEGFSLENTFVRGCISVGNTGMMGALGSNYNPTKFIDFIHWDSVWGNRLRGSGAVFDHCTLGNVSGDGTLSPLAYLEANDPITNSVLYRSYRGIWNAVGNDYNSLYGIDVEYTGSAAGTHSYCDANSNPVDPMDGDPGNGVPALKYLPRIEDGSDLDGTASDGGNRGATILYRIGWNGTLWGDLGYNETTSEPLWPFPNEDLIKEQMSEYYYDNESDGLEPLRGGRGFCANGTGLYGGNITLTSYIWEYLGNPCPPEICDYAPAYHQADLNDDGVINMPELMVYIARWKADNGVSRKEVEEARGIWFSGGVYL